MGDDKEREEQVALIVEVVRRVLDKSRFVDAETHRVHHTFVDEEIERRHRKRELWDKVAQQVMGAAIIGAGLIMLTALGQWGLAKFGVG